jgi:hypothetical protein
VWVGDDVAEDEVEDCGAEGEEGVNSHGAVVVQADFVEVGVCCQAAQTVRCLSRQLVGRCQGILGEGGGYEGEGVEFGDVEAEENVKEDFIGEIIDRTRSWRGRTRHGHICRRRSHGDDCILFVLGLPRQREASLQCQGGDRDEVSARNAPPGVAVYFQRVRRQAPERDICTMY